MAHQSKKKEKQLNTQKRLLALTTRIKERWRYALIVGMIFIAFLLLAGNLLQGKAPVLTGIILILGVATVFFTGGKIYQDALVVIVCFGMAFALLTPILDVPDEVGHLARTMYIKQGELGISHVDSDLMISVDHQRLYEQSQKTIFDNDLRVPDSGRRMVVSSPIKATSAYSFVSYLPQVVGLGVGRLLNFSVLDSFYLGRIANMLVYAAFISFSIYLTPFFKKAFFVAGTIPMNLFLAGSYNQDAFGIGIIFVTIAFFIHLLNKEDGKIGLLEIVLYCGLCVLIALAKFPYVLLVLLLIFIPKQKFKRTAIHLSILPGIIVTAALALVWMKSYSEIPHPHIPDGVDMTQQIAYLMSDPLQRIPILVDNMIEGLTNLLSLFNFGWLSYRSFGIGLLHLFFFSGIAMFFPREFFQKRLTRFGSLAVLIGIYIGIELSMYFTWTPVGTETIDGIQGRYFIGIFPLLPLVFNIGPSFKQLNKSQLKQYDTITTLVPITFVMLALALTIRQYY